MPDDVPDRVDVLVVGSGIAGLVFALRASELCRVAVLTKKERPESNTNYAQGGIAAVFGSDDDLRLHFEDTVAAGAGLCQQDAVDILVREGPGRVRDLIAWGASFSRRRGDLSLGHEGGHSRRRIVRSEDRTGFELERALLEAVSRSPSISVHENLTAVELVGDRDGRCGGAVVCGSEGGSRSRIAARAVMLATGGAGWVYHHTTNPPIATGSGLGLAFRAGAHVANLEFVQFHPTMLHDPGRRSFLISEAVRGEGAVLVDRTGRPIMASGGSLATRDVVARAIDRALKRSGDESVFLDCTPVGEQRLRRRFPHIVAVTEARGWDITRDPIPVVPGAHYFCGGVLTDLDGRTTVPGLLAAGEVAYTGVHGANRLASNSLLEAVVFAHRAADRFTRELHTLPFVDIADPAIAPCSTPLASDARLETRIRGVMWNRVGIVREREGLDAAVETLDRCGEEAGFDIGAAPDVGQAELHSLWTSAVLVARSARWREESRGLHYREDRPYRDNERFLGPTVVHRSEAA